MRMNAARRAGVGAWQARLSGQVLAASGVSSWCRAVRRAVVIVRGNMGRRKGTFGYSTFPEKPECPTLFPYFSLE